jgi:hypothetical protein
MSDQPKRPMTQFAQAVLAASDLIKTKFSGTHFGGSVPRVVNVEAPQVESTGGGKQARESIVLKPDNGDSSQAIAAGFIDVGLRSAELRTYTAIALLYQQRHKVGLDMPEGEYNRFLSELQALLEGEGYLFKLVDAQEQLQRAQPKDDVPAQGGNNMMMFAIGAIGALIVVAAALILLMR